MIPGGRTAPYQLRPAKQRSHRSISISRCRSRSKLQVQNQDQDNVRALPCHHWLQIPHLWHAGVQKETLHARTATRSAVCTGSFNITDVCGRDGATRREWALREHQMSVTRPIAFRVQCWMASCRRINIVMRWTDRREAVLLNDGSSRRETVAGGAGRYVAFEPVPSCL